jgi:hypothetical protein
LRFFDFSGQPIYDRNFSTLNLERPEAAVLIFNAKSGFTSSNVVKWLEKAGKYSVPNERTILCVNKVDLLGTTVEAKKDIISVLNELQWKGRAVMVSAKSRVGLTRMLKMLSSIFATDLERDELAPPLERTRMVNLSEIPDPIDSKEVKAIQLAGALMILTLRDDSTRVLPNPCLLARPRDNQNDEEILEKYRSFESHCPIHGVTFDADIGSPQDPLDLVPDGVVCGITNESVYVSCPSMLGCWKKKSELPGSTRKDVYTMTLRD